MSRASKSASIASHNSRQSRHSSACREKRNQMKNSEQCHSADHKENIVPLSEVYSNSMVAKTLAKENLLHQPLPDNFDDNLYRVCNDQHSGDDCKNTTAVGCKCYGVPGPTQCSKLKVYRPKTAHDIQREDLRSASSDRCPRDSLKADKKDFYSDIDYALCWDLCPPGHAEHKKSSHIDGSNGSLAPAVFSLVPSRDPSPCLYETRRDGLHSPEPPRALSAKCCTKPNQIETRVAKAKQWIETTTPVNPSAVMTIVQKPEPQENLCFLKQLNLKQQNQLHKKPRCSSCTSHGSLKNKNRRESSPKPWSSEEFLEPTKVDYKRLMDREEIIEQRLKQRNIHSSSPNLAVHRQPTANGNGNTQTLHNHTKNNNNNHQDQEHYLHEKSFHEHQSTTGRETNGHYHTPNGRHKNGTNKCKEPICPKLIRSQDSSISSNSKKNGFSAPKLKNHYVKKCYSIPTLMPPFTLWPGTTGQDYPEHWRLASVYQHSYKPIEMRKRNLLQCIYQ